MENIDIEVKIIGGIVIMIVSFAVMAVTYHMHRNILIATHDNPLVMACALSDSDPKPCMAYMGSLK